MSDKWWEKDIPQGGIPVAAILVISYLDAEGEQMYAVTSKGDTSLSSCLGLLELAKLKLVEYMEDK